MFIIKNKFSGPNLVLDNFKFRKDRLTKEGQKWRCTKGSCPVTLCTDPSGLVLIRKSGDQHTHSSNLILVNPMKPSKLEKFGEHLVLDDFKFEKYLLVSAQQIWSYTISSCPVKLLTDASGEKLIRTSGDQHNHNTDSSPAKQKKVSIKP